MSYKLAQLSLTPGRRSQTVSDVYLAQPDSIKEALAGRLFVLIEVERNNTGALKIINFLIDNINNNYYQNEKIYLREKISSLKVEHIFEASLAKTNKNLFEYLEKEKINIDPGLVNITVGILHENMVHFACTGKNKAFLIYKSRTQSPEKTADDQYKIVDIANNGKDKNKFDRQTGKFFNNVISGPIPEKGIFLFANEALPEYISNKQLTEILTTLPPLSAVEQMKGMLTRINSYVSFLGIIIRSTMQEKVEEKKEIIPKNTQESISTFNKTEKSTENLLAPTGIVDTKKFLSSFLGLLRSNKKQRQFADKSMLQDKIFMKRKRFSYLGKIFNFINAAFIYLANFIFFTLKSLTNKAAFYLLFSKIKEKAYILYNSIIGLKELNKKSKLLLSVFFVCCLILSSSLFYSHYKKQQEDIRKEYENLLMEIDQKQNQVDGYLLYNNEDGAKKILNEINDLLKKLPQDTDEQKKKYTELNAKIAGHLEKFRKIARIDNAEEIINFAKNNSANPQDIIYLGELNRSYSADISQKSIYIANISEKNHSTVPIDNPINSLFLPIMAKDKKIYYFNGNNLLRFDPATEKITEIQVDLQFDQKNITAANIYNNKLYLIDAKENKIIKYDKSGNSFSDGKNWLEENIDLSKTVGLAIDGNVYALKSNGQIIKMLKGRLENFEMEAADPAITDAKKLFLDADQAFIYILEPSQKRILVYDKEGKFILQYTSDQWQDLKDMAVDEKNKTIYLINNASILKFSAQHFK